MNKWDIIVVGGGFAGSAAAIAAARQGRKVLLIEKYNCLGGAAVYDLVNPFMSYGTMEADGTFNQLSCGLFSEILNRLSACGGLLPDCYTFNEEILKYVLMQMANESGVGLLFQTYVTSANKEDGVIRSLTASNVSGTSDFAADIYIDATGDANLAFMAGCPYRLGRESDGLCQPMTLCFRLGNVNAEYGADIIARINSLYKKFQNDGKIRNPREDVLLFKTVSPGVFHFNTTRIVKLNPTNGWDVTKAEINAREQVFELYTFLRNNFTEFKDSILLSTGIQIGVRESRMIIGRHTLTQEELLECTRFKDSVAVCNYDIDIHSPDGGGTSHYYFPPGKYYTIPYGCLLPYNADNLLVTGRCISATHEAQASIRIMPTCCSLGEAAGVAAALALNTNESLADINTDILRNILSECGAKTN